MPRPHEALGQLAAQFRRIALLADSGTTTSQTSPARVIALGRLAYVALTADRLAHPSLLANGETAYAVALHMVAAADRKEDPALVRCASLIERMETFRRSPTGRDRDRCGPEVARTAEELASVCEAA